MIGTNKPRDPREKRKLRMRRVDREVTDPARIRAVIEACDCCRLAFSQTEGPYIVPLNFGYEERAEGRRFYFHSAPEGRKLALAKATPRVGFELDTGHRLLPGDTAGACTFAYSSVIGTGLLRLAEEPAEKRGALQNIMARYTGRQNWEIDPGLMARTAVLVLEVTSLTCKENREEQTHETGI